MKYHHLSYTGISLQIVSKTTEAAIFNKLFLDVDYTNIYVNKLDNAPIKGKQFQ